MGLLDSLIGYTDNKAKDIVHYLRMIALPGIKGNRRFFSRFQFSDIETRRFVFSSFILNLSATLAIVNSKYRLKASQMDQKVFNAFNQRINKSPNNLPIKEYIIYRPELKRIIRKERISIDHETNEYSIFNMVWPDRSSFYYRHIHRMPDLSKRTNIIFEDELNMLDFNTPSIDHNKEVLDFFLLHFICCDSNDFPLSSLVWEHLYKNMVALRNYL